MPAFQAPRGTRDLLPDDHAQFARLERLAADLSTRYGYRGMETPQFEQTEVFERGVGGSTDIIEKELFRLQQRSEDGEAWALRPEATAGIVRAYIQHGMQTWPQPVRVSLIGPMFRYDRPQAGRYRQFRQWDVEAIGDPGPAVDAELIELGLAFYRGAELADVQVHLNSIGDQACRPAYLDTLMAFYRRHDGELPAEERRRLTTNPMRLLDSRAAVMVALNAGAPRIADHLCDACAAHFAAVRAHLDVIGVPYRLEPGLVRGLDYYTRTAWEFYRRGTEGQQQALGGGGRYDGLVRLLGGRPTPGIGFALGIDRVVLALEEGGVPVAADSSPLAVVVGADPGATADRLRLATELRAEGLAVRAELAGRKLGRQLEGAGRDGAHFAVIIGDELAEGHVQLRDLQAGTQRSIAVADLAKELRRAEASHRHG
ncbi:MAG TPA: histidine--tRNA ligase [Candidatus Saccharimonadales bacterium]|nr:histidine--tRNA ligase [Candidatus Saccharimonadales bacterium]